jgi:hypothetical protein
VALAGIAVFERTSPKGSWTFKFLNFLDPRVTSSRIKNGNIPKTWGGGTKILDTSCFKFNPAISLLQAIPKNGKRIKVQDIFNKSTSVSDEFAESYFFGVDTCSDVVLKLVDNDSPKTVLKTLVLPVQSSDVFVGQSEDFKGKFEKATLSLQLTNLGVTPHLIRQVISEHASTMMSMTQSSATMNLVELLTEGNLGDDGLSDFLSKENHQVKIFSEPLEDTDRGKLARLLACRYSVGNTIANHNLVTRFVFSLALFYAATADRMGDCENILGPFTAQSVPLHVTVLPLFAGLSVLFFSADLNAKAITYI